MFLHGRKNVLPSISTTSVKVFCSGGMYISAQQEHSKGDEHKARLRRLFGKIQALMRIGHAGMGGWIGGVKQPPAPPSPVGVGQL